MIDFRMGATQSGKSNLANTIIKGLAPQPVALVGFDLKGGVEFTPYWLRMSTLATTRAECCELLDDLLRVLADRMRVVDGKAIESGCKRVRHSLQNPVKARADQTI